MAPELVDETADFRVSCRQVCSQHEGALGG